MGKSAYDRHISALGDAHHVHDYFFGRIVPFSSFSQPFLASRLQLLLVKSGGLSSVFSQILFLISVLHGTCAC